MKRQNRINLVIMFAELAGITYYYKNIKDTLKVSIICAGINVIIRRILEALDKVNYECTLMGFIDENIKDFYRTYSKQIKFLAGCGNFIFWHILCLIAPSWVPDFIFALFGPPERITVGYIIKLILKFIIRSLMAYCLIFGR